MIRFDQPMDHSLANPNLGGFYRDKGFAGRVGFGERPALLVIDLARAWTDPQSPLGSDLSSVVDNTATLLGRARQAGLPIYFTTMAYDPEFREAPAILRAKLPSTATLVRGSQWVQLEPRLERRANEPLIEKQRASAFFGTSLLSQLVASRVDTVLITGCSTSGCIRATAESCFDNGFRTIVVREAVGDRSPSAHQANLCVIDARDAVVVSLDEALVYQVALPVPARR
jgi:maleamate amidohydrolase